MNRFSKYAAGSVRFEVIGGRGERFFNECVNADLPVEHVQPTETGYFASVPLRDYKRLRPLARRNRCTLRVREKYGAYFALLAYRNRWGILLGLALCAALMMACQDLIWNICFIGFTDGQEADVRAKLFEKGIYEGAFQENSRLIRVASEIFTESEEYGWVTLNFIKGRLVVEKTDREKPPEIMSRDLTNVVAISDGVVRRIDLAGGYPQVVPGQYVGRGRVLISGMRLSSYERPLYSRAEGAVWAEVRSTYVYTQPLRGRSMLPTSECRSYYKLYLPWGEAALYGSVDAPQGASRRVTRHPVAPLGFHLPAMVEETQVRLFQETAWEMTPEQAAAAARAHILDAIRMEFGTYEMISETPEAQVDEDAVTLSLHVVVLADIGKQVPYEASGEEKNAGEAAQEAYALQP